MLNHSKTTIKAYEKWHMHEVGCSSILLFRCATRPITTGEHKAGFTPFKNLLDIV